MDLSKELRKKIEKQFEIYFKHVSKYPVIINSMKSDIFLSQMETGINHFKTKEKFNADIFLEYIVYINSIFEDVEQKLIAIESKQENLVKTYDYDTDKVIAHNRNIQNLQGQLTYLNLVLHSYRIHTAKRTELFKEQIFQLQDTKYFEYFGNISQMFDLFPKEQIQSYMKAYFETFEDKIINEIAQINILLKNAYDKDLKELLKDINLEDYTAPSIEKPKEDIGLEGYLTTEALMEKLNIKSQTTITSYRKQGKLNPRKIGRKNYYNEQEVIRLLEKKR